MPSQVYDISFRQGANGYSGAADTLISAKSPKKDYSTANELNVKSGPEKQALLRFDDIFGAQGIPDGAQILSATLVLQTVGSGDGARMHRMLSSWSPTSTWNSLASGVSADGLEAMAAPEVTTGPQGVGISSFDVTASVQAWANGEANHGWVFRSLGGKTWKFLSSEGSLRPELRIQYATNTSPATIGGELSDTLTEDASPTTLLATGTATVTDADPNEAFFRAASGATSYGNYTITADGSWTYSVANGQSAVQSLGTNETLVDSFVITSLDGTDSKTVEIQIRGTNDNPTAVGDSVVVSPGSPRVINVLANDQDIDGDALSVLSVGAPTNGIAVRNSDNTITYTPTIGGPDSFTYTVSDGKGGTTSATVTITPGNPNGPNTSDSYVALPGSSGSGRNLEHDNASKSFYHDGSWWAVLPGQVPQAGGVWGVYQFSGSTPGTGEIGGFSLASQGLQSNSLLTDIAWDAANEQLYVLQFGSGSSHPYLYQLSYQSQTQSWTATATIDLGTKLNPSIWGSNNDLSIGLDQNGNPLILAIDSGSSQGLHLAFPTTSNLSQWGSSTLDQDTTSSGGSNGNSKADFITFSQNGVDKIGVIFSKDGASANTWSFVWHDTAATTSSYAGGWSNEVANGVVHIDDHISAVSDGTTIYAAIKDDQNSIWLLTGEPGNWAPPVLVVDGGKHNPSRPVVVLDESSHELYIMYQGQGDIYMKSTSTANPTFNPGSLGFKILESGSAGGTLYDPQSAAHAVGADTDGYFMLFAKNVSSNDVWYNNVSLGTGQLIA